MAEHAVIRTVNKDFARDIHFANNMLGVFRMPDMLEYCCSYLLVQLRWLRLLLPFALNGQINKSVMIYLLIQCRYGRNAEMLKCMHCICICPPNISIRKRNICDILGLFYLLQYLWEINIFTFNIIFSNEVCVILLCWFNFWRYRNPMENNLLMLLILL